jgi:hypothetical protein
MNFEFRYETPSFSQTHYGLEIRPIIGVRNSEWEFIVNPIVDVGFDALGDADFLPVARFARNLGNDRFVGIGYYSDLGKIGDFLPFEEQRQQIFGADFKLGVFDIELGLGPGLTSGSDRLVAKAILDTVSRSPAERSQSAAGYEGSLAAGCREFSRFYRILFVAVTSGPARPAGWFHGTRIPVLYGNRVLISCHSGRAPANLRGRYEQPQ